MSDEPSSAPLVVGLLKELDAFALEKTATATIPHVATTIASSAHADILARQADLSFRTPALTSPSAPLARVLAAAVAEGDALERRSIDGAVETKGYDVSTDAAAAASLRAEAINLSAQARTRARLAALGIDFADAEGGVR